MKNEKKAQLLINVPTHVKERLKEICDEKGVTLTAFINSLINKSLHPLVHNVEDVSDISTSTRHKLITVTHNAIDAVADLHKEITKLSYDLMINPATERQPKEHDANKPYHSPDYDSGNDTMEVDDVPF